MVARVGAFPRCIRVWGYIPTVGFSRSHRISMHAGVCNINHDCRMFSSSAPVIVCLPDSLKLPASWLVDCLLSFTASVVVYLVQRQSCLTWSPCQVSVAPILTLYYCCVACCCPACYMLWQYPGGAFWHPYGNWYSESDRLAWEPKCCKRLFQEEPIWQQQVQWW